MNIRFSISQIKKQINMIKEEIKTENDPKLRVYMRGQIQGLKRSLQILGEDTNDL